MHRQGDSYVNSTKSKFTKAERNTTNNNNSIRCPLNRRNCSWCNGKVKPVQPHILQKLNGREYIKFINSLIPDEFNSYKTRVYVENQHRAALHQRLIETGPWFTHMINYGSRAVLMSYRQPPDIVIQRYNARVLVTGEASPVPLGYRPYHAIEQERAERKQRNAAKNKADRAAAKAVRKQNERQLKSEANQALEVRKLLQHYTFCDGKVFVKTVKIRYAMTISISNVIMSEFGSHSLQPFFDKLKLCRELSVSSFSATTIPQGTLVSRLLSDRIDSSTVTLRTSFDAASDFATNITFSIEAENTVQIRMMQSINFVPAAIHDNTRLALDFARFYPLRGKYKSFRGRCCTLYSKIQTFHFSTNLSLRKMKVYL